MDTMDLLEALYRSFKSVRLAIALALLVAALALLATLVPQGQEAQVYYNHFPRFWAWLIIATGFQRFSRSALFLVPAALFMANTAVCTVDRFVRRLRISAPRRFGPDLIHIGVLVLVVGGLVTAATRREGFAYLAVGDEVQLTEEYEMTLQAYRFDKYPDGRPRDWVSTVDIARDGTPLIRGFAIEVNRPLHIGGLEVFQTSFGREARATLVDAAGSEIPIRAGRGLRLGQALLILAGVEDSGRTAIFEQWEGHARKAVVRAAVSGRVGDYVVREIRELDVTGLKVVDDPGFGPVLAALVLISVGLALTFIQKARDERL
jgi:hypothetical protein